jgi:putative hydrolase of the HAD superfamily
MIEALIFDLDDTLYPERDFVISGCRAVARHIAGKYGTSANEAYCAMMETLAVHGRRSIMPMIIEKFLGGSVPITELVEVYRQHTPEISLFPGYTGLIEQLAREYTLGLITDGLPEVQRRKVRALGLETRIDQIIYTWDHGPDKEKPHPLSFNLILEALVVEPKHALFVGDNPDKDGKGALGVGMRCVLIQNQTIPTKYHESNVANEDVYMLEGLLHLPEILHLLN